MWRHHPDNLGEFKEKSHGKIFSYKPTKDQWALNNGFKHEVDVLDGVRFANVLATVVHVCVDEDASGKPVTEKRFISQHRKYKNYE